MRLVLFSISFMLFTFKFALAQGHQSFQNSPVPSAPDYSNLQNWAAHPNKKDPSDKIPSPLRKQNSTTQQQVDVFFLHPTIYTDAPKNEFHWNADVNDKKINRKVDNSTIKLQASIFNLAGQVYAPRYRQAHIRSFFDPYKKEGDEALDIAYADVKKAFLYYLEHDNKGKPFIMASHSQGARHLIQLMQELIDGQELQKQLIASYIVGWGVDANAFKEIPIGQHAEQTGCFLTWRTYTQGYIPSWIDANQVCVNPLSWKTDSIRADYKLNEGAVLLGFNTLRKQLLDAQVSGPVLWVGKPNMFLGKLLQRRDYHIGDLNLFYVSVRNNAALRAQTYLNNRK